MWRSAEYQSIKQLNSIFVRRSIVRSYMIEGKGEGVFKKCVSAFVFEDLQLKLYIWKHRGM